MSELARKVCLGTGGGRIALKLPWMRAIEDSKWHESITFSP